MHTNRHNMYIKFMHMYIDSIALQTHVITEAHMQLHTLKTQNISGHIILYKQKYALRCRQIHSKCIIDITDTSTSNSKYIRQQSCPFLFYTFLLDQNFSSYVVATDLYINILCYRYVQGLPNMLSLKSRVRSKEIFLFMAGTVRTRPTLVVCQTT